MHSSTKAILIILLLDYCLAECQIDPLRIQPTPLIFNRDRQIIYPNSGNHVAQINKNDKIVIACPGSELLHGSHALGESIAAKCIDDEKLDFGGGVLDFYSLKCQYIPTNIIRYTGKSCEEGGQEIEIGYSVSEYGFLRQIRICFDHVNLIPIYSHSNITGNIGYRDSRVPRKFFEEDGFYSTSESLDNLYRRDYERNTINGLLDLNYDSDLYIKSHGELFINRGHLTAKGDFVYAFQQLATFHYVNSASQWASFNGGNWNELEISLRQYSDSTGSELEVYTGVYGTTTLRNNRTGTKTELFLHTVNGRTLLPIPQLFWKMIYDKTNYKSIVVIGVNNAYEFDKFEDVICNDISGNITWFNDKLKRQKQVVELGYTYACSVSDFRRIVNRSPALNVPNLLL